MPGKEGELMDDVAERAGHGWGQHGVDCPEEFTGDAEDFARRSLASVTERIRSKVDYSPCLYAVHDKPLEWGVLAFAVCGLPWGHDGQHRAGWSGTGAWFHDPFLA